MNEYVAVALKGAVRSIFTGLPVGLYLMLVHDWNMLWAMGTGYTADTLLVTVYDALKRRQRARRSIAPDAGVDDAEREKPTPSRR